jgi:Ni,Fe-hydrogenase III large subunit
MTAASLDLHNGSAAPRERLPEVSPGEFRAWLLESTAGAGRLAALFGVPAGDDDSLRLIAVVARESEGCLSLLSTGVGRSYPSLTPECPQAHWFEREIAEQWGVVPEGHPWLKPVRFQPPRRRGAAPARTVPGAGPEDPGHAPPLIGDADFFQVAGAEIHEVAVGPVHAGVIEPGHFRFQCHGERVLHLEISLGYQHRGVERALVGGPGPRTIHYLETLAGDTSVGHALAGSLVLEALASASVSARAESLRGIALELERLANHTGDLGALAGDVGFLPVASFCGRLRGDFLNLTALLGGNRLGRGLVRPGGMGFDLDDSLAAELEQRLDAVARDVEDAAGLLLTNQSVVARLEETGAISSETCRDLGLVGVAARACGLERDVRQEFPAGIFRFFQIPVATWHTGDVLARAQVRRVEIQRSLAFVREQLKSLPAGTVRPRGRGPDLGRPGESGAGVPAPEPDRIAVSLVEGWRGEICHVALTDRRGRIGLYKVVDPSFHNWMGLAMALRDEAISDFPLCNKSFNLSYCGHDL